MSTEMSVVSLWPTRIHLQESGLSEAVLDRLVAGVMREDATHRWGQEAWQCRDHDLLKGGLNIADGLQECMQAVDRHLAGIYGRFRYRISAIIMRCQTGFHVAEHIASPLSGMNTVLFLYGDFPEVENCNTRTPGCVMISNPAKRVNESLLPWESPVHYPVTPKRGLLLSMPLCTPHGYLPLRAHTKDTLAIEFHSFPVPEVDRA